MNQTTVNSNRPEVEVAGILATYRKEFEQKKSLTHRQKKILDNLTYCRSDLMGGHSYQCNECHHQEIAYNSCCDRHCPKCQSTKKEEWLEARKNDLLPVEYCHGVFTVPHLLNGAILQNKEVILGILFRAVKETLLTFAEDPKHRLVGELGFSCILHTWDQKMNPHYHIHCVIPAGVWDADQQQWISTPYKFLFPVQAVSKVFRGKFLDYLKQAYRKGELEFHGNSAHLAQKSGFAGLLLECYEKEWVVYIKRPFKRVQHVIDYLGRYTHRVAISNHRLISMDGGRVLFEYRDRKKGVKRVINLSSEQFIARFLLHELPSGFMKIRHYGFMANSAKKKKLALIRESMGVPQKERAPKRSAQERMLDLGVDITLCPNCKKGKMEKIYEFDGPLRIKTKIRKFSPD